MLNYLALFVSIFSCCLALRSGCWGPASNRWLNMPRISFIKMRDSIKDSSDCTVVATAIAKNIPYEKAHRQLARLGRQRHRGFTFTVHAKELGFITRGDMAGVRFKDSLPLMRRGRYVVRHASHVFAVVNGEPYDRVTVSPRLYVKMVYQYKRKR